MESIDDIVDHKVEFSAFLKKWGNPSLFFVYFRPFLKAITITISVSVSVSISTI